MTNSAWCQSQRAHDSAMVVDIADPVDITERTAAEPGAAASPWDVLQAGLVVVGQDFRVLECNAAAAAILAREDGLGIAHGELVVDGVTPENVLDDAMRAAAQGRIGAAAVWSVRNAEPYLLTLTRLTDDETPRAQRRFLVSIADPEQALDDAVLECARALGLTEGEAQLALSLVRGETVTENADRRGVSVHTVRSQLRNIREKLGLSRQAQLITWLTRAALCGPGRLPQRPAVAPSRPAWTAATTPIQPRAAAV